jgi:hypothetical protein
MHDALLARATLAIGASRAIRQQHRLAADRHAQTLDNTRLAIMESAMVRSEVKAYRDNREE